MAFQKKKVPVDWKSHVPDRIPNRPFSGMNVLLNYKTELQIQEEILKKMKAVFETSQPFIDGEFISRQKYKDQKKLVENLKANENK